MTRPRTLYLAGLRDRNEVLFYRLLTEHISEMLLIVYTPTIGTAIEWYSCEFGRPRGRVLRRPWITPPGSRPRSANLRAGAARMWTLIIATDSEGILGIGGDRGVGGIQIAMGKLAGLRRRGGPAPAPDDPGRLDAGTDNLALLAEEMYLASGNRAKSGASGIADDLIDNSACMAARMFLELLLHWEDFGAGNAHRILTKQARQLPDVQRRHPGHGRGGAGRRARRGPGRGVADARPAGGDPRRGRLAGIGIADVLRQVMIAEGLSPDEATRCFYALGSKGLLTSDYPGTLRDFQVPYARPARPRSSAGCGTARAGSGWPRWWPAAARPC